MKYRIRVYENGKFYPQIKRKFFWHNIYIKNNHGETIIKLFDTKEEAANSAKEAIIREEVKDTSKKKDKEIRKESYDI